MWGRSKELLYFSYKMRKLVPHSTEFYIMNYFMKFLGMVLASQNLKGLESENKTLHSILINLTFFGSKGYGAYRKTYHYGVFFISFFLILLCIVTKVLIRIIEKNSENKNSKQKRIHIKLFMKVYVFFLSFIFFFSQHIVEYNVLGIVNVTYSKFLILNVDTILKYFILIFCILNILVIFIICIYFWYICCTISINSNNMNKNLIFSSKINLMAILLLAQPIYTSLFTIYVNREEYFFNTKGESIGKNKKETLLYFNFIITVYLTIQLYVWLRVYNFYYLNKSLFAKIFFVYFSVVSNIVEVIIYFTCTNPITQLNSTCKLCFILLNSLLFTKLHLKYVNHYHLEKFKKDIFNDKKVMVPEEILFYMELIQKYKNEEIPFKVFLHFFSYHQANCTKGEFCPCSKLNLMRWKGTSSQVDIESNSSSVIKKSYYDFVILGEAELARSIHFYSKKASVSYLEILIILQVEYYASFKNEKKLALYFATQYLLNPICKKFSFRTNLYLYEYRKTIFSKFTKKTFVGNRIRLGDEIRAEEQKSIDQFKETHKIYNYMMLVQSILHLLKECCDACLKVYDFRKNIKTRMNGMNRYYQNSENFINICLSMKKTNLKLVKALLEVEGKFKHYETCYLLTSYFTIIYGRIPKILSTKLDPIDTFKLLTKDKKSYTFLKIKNPLMIFIDKNDDFIINYVSRSLCLELGYNLNDLMHKNVNIFFPGQLKEFHRLYMKKFLLFSHSSYKKTSYILDKERFLRKMCFNANVVPSLTMNLGIIFNIHFIKDSTSPSIIYYYLLLDKDLKIISSSKNFTTEFFFTLEMINMLQLNFCQFFGAPQEKLKKTFAQLRASQKEERADAFNMKVLEEENKVTTLFSLGRKELIFTNRNSKKIARTLENQKELLSTTMNISKIKAMKNIENIHKIIEELGFDIEWYARANYFKDRLSFSNTYEHFDTCFTICPFGSHTYYKVVMKENVNVLSHKETMQIFQETLKNINFFYSSIRARKDSETVIREGAQYLNLGKQGSSRIHHSKIGTLTKSQKIPTHFLTPVGQSSLAPNPLESPNKPPGTPNADFGLSNPHTVIQSTNSKRLTSQVTQVSQVSQLSQMSRGTQNSTVNMLKSSNSVSLLPTTQNSTLNPSSIQARYFGDQHEDPSELGPIRYVNTANLFKKKEYEQNLIMIYKLLCISVTVISFFFFILNMNLMRLFKDLFDINIYSMLVKSDIYFCAMCIYDFCFKAYNNASEEINAQRWKLGFRGNELIEHYSTLIKTINNLKSGEHLSTIYEALTRKSDFQFIQKDFLTLTKTSSVNEEILLLHYYMTELVSENSFSSCRIKDVFANKNYENLPNVPNFPSPNKEEEVMFYIIHNVIINFKGIFEELTETSNSLLLSYGVHCKRETIIYNILIFLLSGVILIIYFLVMIHYVIDVVILLTMLYSNHNGKIELGKEKEIIYIKTIIEDFSEKNCESFEDFKVQQKINHVKTKEIRENKRIQRRMGTYLEGKRQRHAIQKSVSQMQHQNEEIISTTISAKTIRPKFVYISLFLTLISVGIFFVYQVVAITIIYKEYDEYGFTSIIGINFLDRIPKICELIIYASISILLNDINYITFSFDQYNANSYFNYYNVTFDTDNNIFFSILKDSQMAYLYYQSMQIKKNIEIFVNENNVKYVLQSTVRWENLFNQENGVCIYGSLGFELFNPSSETILDTFKTIATTVTDECKGMGQGVTSNSLNNIIDFSLRQMIGDYSDFARLPSNERDGVTFLKRNIFVDSIEVISGPLKKIHNTIIMSALEDMKFSYNRGKILGGVFSLVSGFFCLFLTLESYFCSLKKTRKKIAVLYFMKKIFDSGLTSENQKSGKIIETSLELRKIAKKVSPKKH